MNIGLRLSELTKLEWCNVNLDFAFLTVIDAHSKSGSERHVPLNAGTLAMLKAWTKKADKRYVFANADGVPMSIISGWPELRARRDCGVQVARLQARLRQPPRDGWRRAQYRA
jgi:integrase